ncbi:SAM-dependent methyltransferase [Enterocytozoon bieneusi H348]|nr:SAM-dependent methyltransferase [Enterocytozoon bieneusi H348]|eukprot:XP_002650230.1 SAM-dependent methyltransferase [Enterocytozoon bieneusi H348]
MRSSVNFEFFDKYPINKNIIQADIESIPRQCKTFNIVVCCLSMIKNDISNIIKEVNRILKIKGIFLFAELKSRIKNISIFTNNIKKYGFKVKNINSQNKCFIICKFEKIHDIEKKKLQSLKLNNYLYKKK